MCYRGIHLFPFYLLNDVLPVGVKISVGKKIKKRSCCCCSKSQPGIMLYTKYTDWLDCYAVIGLFLPSLCIPHPVHCIPMMIYVCNKWSCPPCTMMGHPVNCFKNGQRSDKKETYIFSSSSFIVLFKLTVKEKNNYCRCCMQLSFMRRRWRLWCFYQQIFKIFNLFSYMILWG